MPSYSFHALLRKYIETITATKTNWQHLVMTTRIVEHFWSQSIDFIHSDISESEKDSTKLKDYYGNDARYFLHDYLDLRRNSSEFEKPIEQWDNRGFPLPLDFMDGQTNLTNGMTNGSGYCERSR